MKRYQKEIAITLVCLLIAGGFVYYFFQSIKWEKQEAKANSYLLVPSSVEAMLFLDKSENLFLNKLKQTDKSDFLSRYIPPLYLDLFRNIPVNQLLLSFHSEGVVCYLPTTPREEKQLRSGLAHLLNTYPPHRQKWQDIDLYYYADKENRFAGCFYAGGYWVSSYNKGLLEQVLRNTLPTAESKIGADSMFLGRGKAAVKLYLSAKELPLFVTQGDSIVWKYEKDWINADIYTAQDRLSAFLDFPIAHSADTLNAAIVDTFRLHFGQYLRLSIDTLSAQFSSDESALYITLSYPIN